MRASFPKAAPIYALAICLTRWSGNRPSSGCECVPPHQDLQHDVALVHLVGVRAAAQAGQDHPACMHMPPNLNSHKSRIYL